MADKEIQIVAFNNPYPPNFGGAIDMFYKIKALHNLGIGIHLHLFYNERDDVSGLQNLCKSINTYKQNRLLVKHISFLPFSNTSRNSKLLEERLQACEAPILFESLRTLMPLKHIVFKQKVAVRCHNIEHDYSFGLFRSETNWLKKIAHLIEGKKQRRFETILNRADVLFSISNYEQSYFSENYNAKSIFLPVFQGYKSFEAEDGFGKYALFHGDLETADNLKSALFLVDVFSEIETPLVIAGEIPDKSLLNKIDAFDNISFQEVKNYHQLQDLIKNAHVNTLYSFQRSGTKLKVFNALFNGRHCIVNKNMVDDEGILDICSLAESKADYRKVVQSLFKKEYKRSEAKQKALSKYNDVENAKIIVEHLL